MPDSEEALRTLIIAHARFYRLASDRCRKRTKPCSLVKTRESAECRFADQKVGVRLSETLAERSLSWVNIKDRMAQSSSRANVMSLSLVPVAALPSDAVPGVRGTSDA